MSVYSECGHPAYGNQCPKCVKEAGAAEERAKIVAWLRKRDGFEDCYSELKDQWLSDRIARGEHLK